MEKLCFGLILFCLGLVTASAQVQDSLCVFATKGTVLLKKTGRPLYKGDYIRKDDILKLTKSSLITAIDHNGSAYQYQQAGECSFKKLLTAKRGLLHNLTVRYLKFLYLEFTGKQKKETVIAGVYRGNELLLMPPDSALVSNRNLKFVWQDANTNLYYFFLRNKATEELFKIGVSGTEIKLYEDMSIFRNSTQFEWTVDSREYPDLKNIGWNRLEVLDGKIVEKKMRDYIGFASDLKNLGFSNSEIHDLLCSTYCICN